MTFATNDVPSPPRFGDEKPLAEVFREDDEFRKQMAEHNRKYAERQSQRQEQETAVADETIQKTWADWISQKIAVELAPLTQRIDELPQEFAEATGEVIGDMRKENEGLRHEVAYLRERIDRLTDILLGSSRPQDARPTEGRSGVAPLRRVD
jgi:DNA repair exonuclease SbcCD ATPase subunit